MLVRVLLVNVESASVVKRIISNPMFCNVVVEVLGVEGSGVGQFIVRGHLSLYLVQDVQTVAV